MILSRVQSRRPGFTLLESLGVFVVLTLLISLLLPAVQQTREVARRTQCQHNLRQIGVALATYHHAFRVLPPGSVNSSGPIRSTESGYHVSWLVQLLPQLDYAPTYKAVDFSDSIYSKTNKQLERASISALLQCSSSAVAQSGISSYSGSHSHIETPIDADNTGVLFLNSSISHDDLTDGDAYTLFVSEHLPAPRPLSWMSGTNATLRNTGNPDYYSAGMVGTPPLTAPTALQVGSFGSYHPTGINMLFGDGAVRCISPNIALEVVQRLAHRNDGEYAPAF